jgi:tetratricopeptide (TPR) repeat protein
MLGFSSATYEPFRKGHKCLYRVVKADPKLAFAWNCEGDVLYLLGRYEDANKSYDNTIKINPNYARAWDNKGNALAALGKYNESFLTEL